MARRGPGHQVEGPDAGYLAEALTYDPETGSLRWRERPLAHFKATRTRTAEHSQRNWNAKFAGTVAGSFNPRTGYRHVLIAKRSYLEHRVAWALRTGSWPVGELDHRDGDGSNNRWSNLRLATRVVNNRNQRQRRDNSSGATGVYELPSGRWKAQLCDRSLGTFESFTDAVRARRAAERASGVPTRRGERR